MITWSQTGAVAEVVLDGAPCNEIGVEMLEGLERFLGEFDPDTARVLILRSARPTGFSAGADLRELFAGIDGRDPEAWVPELRSLLDRIHAVMDALDTLPVATIGVVHGVCFGGGLELALTCDLRIAERTARFAFPELRLGLIPGFGGIPRLNRDVGNAVVRDLLLTGRSINARKAVDVGLASQMVPTGVGVDVARRLAEQVAKFDPVARATAKAFSKPIPRAALDAEKAHFMALVQRPPVVEALRTFCTSTDIRPYLA